MLKEIKLLPIFSLVGITLLILSGCGEENVNAINQKTGNKVVETNFEEDEQEESEIIEKGEEEPEVDEIKLTFIEREEHLGGEPLPIKMNKPAISQDENNIFLVDVSKETTTYTILENNKTFTDLAEVELLLDLAHPTIKVMSNKLLTYDQVMMDDGWDSEMIMKTLGATGATDDELPNDVKNLASDSFFTSYYDTSNGPGIMIIKWREEKPTTINIYNALTMEEELSVEWGEGKHEIIENESFRDQYEIGYIDLVNNRIITYNQVIGQNTTIQLFDLNTGEPMWDDDGQRLTIELGHGENSMFHVTEDGILTVFGHDHYKPNQTSDLHVNQFDAAYNELYYDLVTFDVKDPEGEPIMVIDEDGGINIYDFPTFKEQTYLDVIKFNMDY